MKARILGDSRISPPPPAGFPSSSAFPTNCRLGNGDLLCAYRRGREKHSRDGVLLVQRSGDEGRSWTDPIVISDRMARPSPESIHAGTVVQANDGTVFAFFTAVATSEAEAYIFSESGRQWEQHFHSAESRDGGRTWTKEERVVLPGTPPLRYINTRPLALPDGDLLVPIEVTVEKRQAVMMGRRRGKTADFGPFGFCANDPTGELSFGDPKLVRLPDGRIWLGLWTFRNDNEETQPLHVCISEDEGRSWSRPKPIGLCCQNFAALVLPGGRMIIAGNIRVPPEGIRLWSSPDGGSSWDAGDSIQMWDARQHRMLGQPAPKQGGPAEGAGSIWAALPGFTFGAPDLCPAGEGVVLLTYYAVDQGMAEIRACRFALD